MKWSDQTWKDILFDATSDCTYFREYIKTIAMHNVDVQILPTITATFHWPGVCPFASTSHCELRSQIAHQWPSLLLDTISSYQIFGQSVPEKKTKHAPWGSPSNPLRSPQGDLSFTSVDYPRYRSIIRSIVATAWSRVWSPKMFAPETAETPPIDVEIVRWFRTRKV